MNAELMDHLAMGTGIALLACFALLFMVYRELAPSGGLSGRGKLLLTVGVGMGVFAFATKVAALAVMVAVPELTIAPLSTLHAAHRHGQPQHRERITPPELMLFRPYYVWRPLPAMAPVSADMAALGKRLFNDVNLSRDRSVACASCHDVEQGAGVDGLRTSEGIGGQVGSRNAPTVWNAAFQDKLFWDGRAPSLEEQAKGPPVNPIEMGMHRLEDVAVRVAEDPGYRRSFEWLFGDEAIPIERIASAIAAYERTLVAADTPYDRYVAGDASALNAAQVRGMKLFASVGCVVCHHGPNFSSASRFDARAPYRLFPAFANDYTRRYRLDEDGGRLPQGSRRGVQRGLWRVPSLRNVALTAPYFHNGAVDKLEDAVRVMATAQLGRRIVPQRSGVAGGHELSEADVLDIAAFLGALSSDRLAAGMLLASPQDWQLAARM